MSLLTEGLKDFAGDSLRRALVRFTGTPLMAFLSGTVATLLIQSSSATTVAVIGFVSAGLLTFPQALGVVFGASLGTTGTGWIVAWIGLKINVGLYALPMVGAGAFLRLLGRGRWKALGGGLAGFALIFVGIDTLQSGMQGLAGAFNLAALPDQGFLGHLVAIAVGILMTALMQSSSAAVATTLTALSADAVNFEQAASLVIGAAIGTTVTGALAAIGASVPAKRTALAHVLFNLATGLIALALLPLFLMGIESAQQRLGWDEDATSLAAFHTSFIAVGVLVFLPAVRRYADTIERLIPDRGPQLTRHLDRTLRHTPAVALEATRRALRDTAREIIGILKFGLETGRWHLPAAHINEAVEQIQAYIETLHANPEDESLTRSRLAQVHAIDHLLRLSARLKPSPTIQSVLGDERLRGPVSTLRRILDEGAAGLDGAAGEDWLVRMESMARDLAQIRRDQRPAVIEQTAVGQQRPAEALHLLDAYRWLDRAAHHVWRACAYLDNVQPEPYVED